MLTDETPAPLETSRHGNWISTGENSGAYTFRYLIGSAYTNIEWTIATLSGKIKYDPRQGSWNGPFTISLVDQNVTIIFSDTGQ